MEFCAFVGILSVFVNIVCASVGILAVFDTYIAKDETTISRDQGY